MNFRIVNNVQLSGKNATIYSVVGADPTRSLLDVFLQEHRAEYPEEVKGLVKKLRAMGQQTGLREGFFRLNEGLPGDLVVALSDGVTDRLRLYGIRYGSTILLVGGGGPKFVRAWQDDPKLKQEAERMIELSKALRDKVSDKEIRWSEDEMNWEGDLTIQIETDEQSNRELEQ